MTHMPTNSETPEVKVSSWRQKKNFEEHAIEAFKTGLAATICVWLGNLLGLSRQLLGCDIGHRRHGIGRQYDVRLVSRPHYRHCHRRIPGLVHLLRLARPLSLIWTVSGALHLRLQRFAV